MIERKSALTLAACLLVAGGGYWWLQGGELDLPLPGRAHTAEAEDGGEPAAAGPAEARYEKAILACLLAASYGAERGARIDQVETLTAGLRGDAAQLAPAERQEYDALMAQLPAHRRERDASYALYFNGIAALAGAGPQQTAAAFDAVGAELDNAGLQRLTRYIPTIRRHIETNGQAPRDAARDAAWIKELKNAVSS